MVSKIQNVFVFVSDALRFDHLPKDVQKMGEVVKTVASSTISPTSFASILSGLHPPAHGVHTFAHRLDESSNIMHSSKKYDISFYQTESKAESEVSDPIFRVVGQDPSTQTSLANISSPFIQIERNLQTHAPYGLSEHEKTANTYLAERSEDLNNLIECYKKGSQQAVDQFTDRIEVLKQRGMLKNTLIIFTSDHGELLGEFAQLSHLKPTIPELVYVPTVIIPPQKSINMKPGVISHIDIVPMVSDILDLELPWNPHGKPPWDSNHPGWGYNEITIPKGYSAMGESDNISNKFAYQMRSLWDSNGGWIINESNMLSRIIHTMFSSFPNQQMRNTVSQNPRGYMSFLSHELKSTSKQGNPSMSLSEARKNISDIKKMPKENYNHTELGDDEKEQLRKLGYW